MLQRPCTINTNTLRTIRRRNEVICPQPLTSAGSSTIGGNVALEGDDSTIVATLPVEDM